MGISLRTIRVIYPIYKIISNILKHELPEIISLNEFVFVKGRIIVDNILIVHEILYSLKAIKGAENRHIALKLDMPKAYDQVEWDT